jgi:hypothetical protein
LPGTWGSNALNPNFVSIDGLFGGTTTISASNAPIVLTSPSGFTPTPSAGPTQAQNAVLQFTGTLTANVQVTLPIPRYYIINNQTTGAFVLSFRAIGSGQVIAVDQQDDVHIYNNGTNVRFVNLGRIGETAMWAGITALPAWVTACTADSDDLARVYRFDLAQDSEMISPTITILMSPGGVRHSGLLLSGIGEAARSTLNHGLKTLWSVAASAVGMWATPFALSKRSGMSTAPRV